MTGPSVFEAAGGAPAFAALAAAHHERCLADPLLSHPFAHGTHPQHVEHLAAYLGEVFGGPAAYSAACGDQTRLLGLHAGQDAPPEMGERFAACFAQAVQDAHLPTDPRLRAVLAAYMAWAVDDVMAYAPSGSRVGEGLTVPRWSWDGLQPAP